VVDINPHLHSRSVSEDKRTGPTSGSGNVTPKREVSFLERGGGEKERGKKQGNEVNILPTRMQMKEVPVSEDAVMPTTAGLALLKTAQQSSFRSEHLPI